MGIIPKRYIVTFWGFVGMFNVYTMRVNLSVAMVAMVNNSQQAPFNDSDVSSSECPVSEAEDLNVSFEFKGNRYDWDSEMQGWVMSSFFYGYFISLLVSGYVAEKYGATRVFGAGIFLTAILTVFTPLVVEWWGVVPLIFLRVVEGLGEGVAYPSMICIVSRWSPALERSRINSVICAGSFAGAAVALGSSGWLCASDFLGGWPAVFYVFGFITCVWYGFWLFLIYETPQADPNITAEELFCIDGGQKMQKFKVPWKGIAATLPFWAVMVTNFGTQFGNTLFLTELPTYISTVHHINIETVGMLSALPYVANIIVSLIASYCADKLRASAKLKITTIRKILNSIGGYGAAAALLVITLFECRTYPTIVLFTLGFGINGFTTGPGFPVTLIDMSPDFAGTLMGLSNGIASTSGIIVPKMVGIFTANGYTISNWNKVFYVTAAVYLSTTTFFALFGSAELQPWGRATPGDADAEKHRQPLDDEANATLSTGERRNGPQC